VSADGESPWIKSRCDGDSIASKAAQGFALWSQPVSSGTVGRKFESCWARHSPSGPPVHDRLPGPANARPSGPAEVCRLLRHGSLATMSPKDRENPVPHPQAAWQKCRLSTSPLRPSLVEWLKAPGIRHSRDLGWASGPRTPEARAGSSRAPLRQWRSGEADDCPRIERKDRALH